MRKHYLDGLRGLAVVVMVLAHVTDGWTSAAGKQADWHVQVVFISGLAAPLFLFLAGLTLSMAAVAKATTLGHAAAAARAWRHGWQIFALAFLFRLQSQLLGWGPLINFLKVDILNVMGLAMAAAAALWGLSTSRAIRIFWFAVAAAAATFFTPLVREWSWLASLPDPIEAYLRPIVGKTTFAMFPWAGFLFAGAMVGELVAAVGTRAQELRLHGGLLAAGVAAVVLGYWASFQPSLYPVADFWTSSPTFFFIRLGIAAVLLPLVYVAFEIPTAAARRRGQAGDPPGSASMVTVLGRSSLFVYWIHVEIVYGVLGRPIRRALPLEASLAATVVLCLVVYGLVLWKNRLMEGVHPAGAFRLVAPVLK